MSHAQNTHQLSWITASYDALCNALPDYQTPAVDVLSAENSDATLQQRILPYLDTNNYDTLVCLDAWTAHQVVDIIDAGRFKNRTVFAGVRDLHRFKVFDHHSRTRELVTGLELQAGSIMPLLSSTLDLYPGREILVPYNPHMQTGALAEMGQGFSKEQLKEIDKLGLDVRYLPLSEHESVETAVAPLIHRESIIVPGYDNTAMAKMEQLIELGRRHNVPVCAQSSTAVAKGAVLGSGGSGYDHGALLAKMLIELTLHNRKAKDVKIEHAQENSEVRFNDNELYKQGLNPDPRYLRAMRMRSIFAPLN
jgi:ABC-type uncharacterized transport system substrate-binding protein